MARIHVPTGVSATILTLCSPLLLVKISWLMNHLREIIMANAADYMDNVRKYDGDASEDTVQKICNYLGIALANKDSSLVSCSDQTEIDRVINGFCAKKLGMSADEAAACCKKVCETMKEDRMKSRVTFYYLCAKNCGKLDQFGG